MALYKPRYSIESRFVGSADGGNHENFFVDSLTGASSQLAGNMATGGLSPEQQRLLQGEQDKYLKSIVDTYGTGQQGINALLDATGGDFTRVKQLKLLPNADWNYLGQLGSSYQSARDPGTMGDPFNQFLLGSGLMLAGGAGLNYLGAQGAGVAMGGAELAGGAGTDALIGQAAGDTLGAEFTGGLTGQVAGDVGLNAGGFNASALGAGGGVATTGGLNTGLATGAGALTAGHFAGETLNPVIDGLSQAAASEIGKGATQAATGSALQRFLDGNATAADILSLLGTAGATGLGVYGAGEQADALRDIANQARADRQPFYDQSLAWLNDPSKYLEGPGKASMDAVLRRLSVSGNPTGMPSSLALAGDYGLRSWLDAVTGMGNLGLAGEDSRNALQAGAAQSDADQLNALGYGLQRATSQPNSIEELLRRSGVKISLT